MRISISREFFLSPNSTTGSSPTDWKDVHLILQILSQNMDNHNIHQFKTLNKENTSTAVSVFMKPGYAKVFAGKHIGDLIPQ